MATGRSFCTYATSEFVVPRSMPIGRGGALGSKISKRAMLMPPARLRWRSPRRGSAGRTAARRPCRRARRAVPARSREALPTARARRRAPARSIAAAMRAHRVEVLAPACASASASRCSSISIRNAGSAFGSLRPRRPRRPRSASSASARRMGSRTMRHASLTSTAFASARPPLARARRRRTGRGAARATARGAPSRPPRGRRRSARAMPRVANGSMRSHECAQRHTRERVTAAAAALLVAGSRT